MCAVRINSNFIQKLEKYTVFIVWRTFYILFQADSRKKKWRRIDLGLTRLGKKDFHTKNICDVGHVDGWECEKCFFPSIQYKRPQKSMPELSVVRNIFENFQSSA